MPGPWEKYGGQPAQPGGVVTVGNPRPPEPPKPSLPTGWAIGPDGTARPVPGLPDAVTNPTKNDAPSGYRFKPDGSLEAIPGGPADKGGKAGSDAQTALSDIGSVIKAARRAKVRSDGWFMTGFLSGLGAKTPAGASLQGDLDIIGSNVAFDRLQKMRAESPTGGALGSITEKELQLLQNSTAAINPGQSDADFQRNMDSIIQRYSDIYQRLGGNPADLDEAQDKDNPNNAALYSRGDIGFNTPDGPDNPLTPEQQAAYDAWNKANPNATADQLNAFAQSIGVTLGNADEIVAARDKGAGVAPGSTAIDRLTPQEQQEVDKKVGETGGFMRTAAGVADTATLGTSNKLIAALRDLAGKGEYDRELLKANAITDQIADESPLAYRGGQFVGGLALPGFGARSVGQLARVGAGYGAAYGLGSSDSLADVPANVATNAAIGGGAGAAGGAVGNFLGRLGTNRAAGQGREVYDAAERLGMVDEAGNVQLMPADVGGPMTRRLTGAGAQGPVSAIPIVRRAQQVTEAAQGARDRIAQSVGNPAEVEAAGQAVSRGSEDFIRRTSARGGDLYKRAEAAAGDVRVPLPRAIEVLDRNIAELGEVPGGSQGLDVLQGLRQQLDGEFSVKGIRGMRTALRDKFMSEGLRGSDLQRRVEEVVSAASEDIADGLAQQGNNNAAGLYRLADRYWRARLDTIDNVLQPIIGRQGEKSGEEVIAAVNRAAVGNNARLRGLLKALPEEDQSTVRATLISQLGRASDQNAAGDAFSLGSFLTQWNKLSPGAKRTLFGDDTRNALEDLARVADGSKQAQRYQNFSNSAGGVIGQVALSGGIGTLGGFMPLVAATISQYGAGRLLASPRFTRWLVGAARGGNPAQHVERLGTIAAREGAIAGEVTGLQQALLRAMNDNRATLPVAADSQADQRRQ